MSLIFDEQTLLDENIFKFESRLKSVTNKYTGNGAILTTFFNIRENATTVDRGLQNIDQIFGKKSPLRFNKIINFPLFTFDSAQLNTNNTDETGVEDITVEGEYIVQPSTIVPNPNDFFILNHLKMKAVFQITEVQYDSMKIEGFYKIKYRLYSTSDEIINDLNSKTIETYHCDLNAIGTNINPIIREDDFIKKSKIIKMVNSMIQSYCALFYNERHNCFLFYDQNTGNRLFDMCGNEFMAKHSLINASNSNKTIILHEKLRDIQLPLFYNNSIYKWIELDCPKHSLQKFYYILNDAIGYINSSFYRWFEDDIYVIQPLALYQAKINYQKFSFFDNKQIKCFEENSEPNSDYEKIICKFINGSNISLSDIPLTLLDSLLASDKRIEVFLYTPIVLYIVKKVLKMN